MLKLSNIPHCTHHTGIGYALCKQLATKDNCHVFLTARNPDRGQKAVDTIRKLGGSVEFIPLDTCDEASIKNAAKTTKDILSEKKLYGIVNNAGIGINTGISNELMLKTNLYGPKLVCENFLDLLDPENGRIVNLGSGGGPSYVSGVRSNEDLKILCSPDSEACTWEWIENYAQKHIENGYGFTKAMLACYTGLFAREHPNIKTSCVTPGYILTQMTDGYGATKSPEEGLVSIRKALFDDLPGNGWYYGSDGERSPYHFMRSPGEPVYDGVNPYL